MKTNRPHSDDTEATERSDKIGKLKTNPVSDDKDLPEICEHTTINELADIVRRLDKSLTLRIYDEGNQVFGAIRLISAEDLDHSDHLHKFKSLPMFSH